MSDKPGAERQSHEEWLENLERLDLEIVRLAVRCELRLLEPGVIARILDNDARDCAQGHGHSFERLRGLLCLHFHMQQELAEAFGMVDTEQIVRRVWEQLRPRLGDALEPVRH